MRLLICKDMSHFFHSHNKAITIKKVLSTQKHVLNIIQVSKLLSSFLIKNIQR